MGGGGSPSVPKPVKTQQAVSAQPVLQLMSEAEERNKKFAAALMTQDWLKPPTLGVPGINRRDVLGL